MTVEEPRIETLVAHLEEIARMLETDGIGLSLNGEAILKGLTPGPEQFSALVDWLRRNSVEDIRARNVIGEDYPPGREFADRAAGMLVVPLSRPARDYLIFFRQEATRTVNWAGDPAKPAGVGPLGERLTPRRSFELWKETVRGHSMPWTTVECSIVESLRVSLLEIILRMSDTAAVERRRSQERQDLLIAELNHRVRNILGLIRGVITQSRDSAQTLDAFTAIVGGRIQALARAHDQITADQWGPASLANLIAAEAGAYLGGKAARVVVRGRDALVGPEAFTTIALVIHEMITNSAKYGALSDSHGRVDIATSFDPLRRLKIEWSEHGGPPVKPPSRRGFGSTVIERSITHDLKGEARLDFALAGLRAEFIIPAAYAQPSLADPPAAAAPSRPEPFAFVAPDDVLLVEDNIIIALDAEEIIRTIGVATVRTVGGVADAMKAIADKIPDFGLLDVNLGNETSFEIAARLMELGVPFAFTSGYGEQIAFPERFATIRKVRKPYSVEVLADVLAHPAPRADTDS
jgi:light-regulated signal transduction histidine kinase (bacteriophytochrome)